MTVEELAQALGLASATVRRHLDILQRDQLVSWSEARRQTGRPHYVFFLTDRGHERLPRQYDRLASLLLLVITRLTPEETTGQKGPELINMAMSRVGHLLAEEYRSQVVGEDLEQKVEEVARVLGQESLSAEWIQAEDGFRIHCYNCPFLRVATAYPAVCLSHLEMLADLLGTDIWREECMAQGDGRCTYVVPQSNHN